MRDPDYDYDLDEFPDDGDRAYEAWRDYQDSLGKNELDISPFDVILYPDLAPFSDPEEDDIPF